MFLLNLSSSGNSSWSNIFSMIAQLFSILVVFVAVMALAVYVTKWVASAKHHTKGGSYNLKIIESMSLGFQNGIHLVRVGKKYVLLGITKEKINFLAELNEEDIFIEDDEKKSSNFPTFEKYIGQMLQKKQNGKDDD